MIGKIILYVFMSAVILFGCGIFYNTFLGPSRSGNYLRIRKPGRHWEGVYSILPVYRFVLRRIIIYFAVILPFFLLLPMYFSFGISVLVLLGAEWWGKGRSKIKRSIFGEWTSNGYTIKSLLLIIFTGAVILSILHFIFYPLLFKMITGYLR